MSVTAEIISFPARAAASAPTVPRASGGAAPFTTRAPTPTATPAEARLSRAVAGLDAAMIAQRTAMLAWKASLTDLKLGMRRLNTSLRGYDDNMGRLDARVATLKDQAEKLGQWAGAIQHNKGG